MGKKIAVSTLINDPKPCENWTSEPRIVAKFVFDSVILVVNGCPAIDCAKGFNFTFS